MSAQEQAGELLVAYMRRLCEAAGLPWDDSNAAEVRQIVYLIVSASSRHDSGRGKQVRYVIADGGRYTEWRVTVIPTVEGNAVVYEGSGDVTAPVFDGPAWKAADYASTRGEDLTARGYVRIRED